ncbi:L-lactate dehydrogenase [Sphingobium subterraneum]|uniref:L-lactate dehydrogenase (Cytochrome) n=1 Tax=Sphingobium subterraneum TaxID=627688 RepID=A0A841IXX9_9SPHN|nr:L-lactate dehydrogenase [Sphingobium subterraneum]MBB6122992.1 L-lactate dehydrogenase (cytochrome) [Sphingobium subterraneum]
MAALPTYKEQRAAARRRLPHMLFEYIDSGAVDERSLRANHADFDRFQLKQRVMRDMSDLDMSGDFLGQPSCIPVALGPVGFAGMYARRGEVQAARAAAAEGVPFCLSAVSVCDYEEVCRDSGMTPWFQLYMIRDRAYMRDLIARVVAAGAQTLVFTVDMPLPGVRYRDARSGLYDIGLRGLARQMWQGIGRPAWLWDVYLRGRPHGFGNFTAAIPGEKGLGDYWAWIRENFDCSTNWADLAWVRSLWPGKIIIKGVLCPEDAIAAFDAGADGIIVSNHGGRQLDGVSSGIAALPGVVDAVGGRGPIWVDGGIRSGLDILKALALGADGCLLGRAWAFALAAGGEQNVAAMLRALKAELRVAMTLTGCRALRDADPSLLDRSSG